VTEVRVVDSDDGFDALRPEWNALLADSAADTFFLTWEWLRTAWRHMPGERDLFILTVRDGERLLAIAPCARQRRIRGLAAIWPRVELLGGGDAGSDYLDVIARAGHEARVAVAIAEFIASRQLIVEWPRIAADGATALKVADELAARGWRQTEGAAEVSPVVHLRGHTWESYVRSLGSSHRSNVRHRLRRLERNYSVEVKVARAADERRAMLAWLATTNIARWQQHGNGSTAFGTPAALALHEEMSQLALTCGWLRLMALQLDGVTVASVYGFLYHGTFYYYQTAFDESHAKESVGLSVVAYAIRAAIDEGAEYFDFLGGTQSYKFLWTSRTRTMTRLELDPPHWRGWLFGAARQMRRRTRRWGKQLIARARGKWGDDNVRSGPMAAPLR